MPLQRGQEVGPYRITGELGAGGMGQVYLAHDPRLGRDVAIKILPPELSGDERFQQRFAREARTISQLQHPNICALFDVGAEGDLRFLVMELVGGETLEERLSRVGALPCEEALQLFEQLADALVAAHERGIVHRDLKPANLKITAQERLKILDFGIAKALHPATATTEDDETLLADPPDRRPDLSTGEGVLIGTPAYMSPEQARGQDVDRGADVWAFGVVLFQTVAGRLPFEGDSPSDYLASILRSEPLWKHLPVDLPRPVRRLLERCLEKKVDDRLRDLGDARLDLRDGLRQLRGELDETGEPWRPSEGLSIPGRRHWLLQSRLGEGGFGEVWLARHEKTREQHVFKFCDDEKRVSGLKREVVLFRLLKEALGGREDIAKILDWEFDEPPYFLESEYTEGGDLIQWARDQGGLDQVPLATRLDLAVQVAEALGAAHSVGVLHKDIKPSNILIRAIGSEAEPAISLTDFGVGMLTDPTLLQGDVTAAGLTRTLLASSSSSAGTPLYIAPEALEGKQATTRSDVYSLGVVLYQLSIGTFQRALAPGWERDIGDDLLREDIAACVEGRPEHRISSADALAQRLRTLQERRSERAEAEAQRQLAARGERRKKWFAGATAVGLTLTTLVGLFALREGRRAEEEAAVREEAEWRDYVSSIRLAAAQLDEGNSDAARALLEGTAPRFRDWEWGYLANKAWPDFYIGRGEVRDPGAYASAVELWRDAEPIVVTTLPPPPTPILHLGYRSDRDHLVVTTMGGPDAITVWDTTSGTRVCSVAEHQPAIWTAAFHEASNTLATGGTDYVVNLWDAHSCEFRQQLRSPFRGINGLEFDETGERLLAVASMMPERTAAVLWHLSDLAVVASVERRPGVEDGSATAVAHFQEPSALITWGRDVAVWSLDDQQPQLLTTPDPVRWVIGAVAGGQLSWGADSAGRPYLWTPGSDARALPSDETQAFQSARDWVMPEIHPEANLLATVDQAGLIDIWTLDDGEHLANRSGFGMIDRFWQRLRFNRDSTRLAVVGDRGVVSIVAPGKTTESSDSRIPAHPGIEISGARFTPDGANLVTYAFDGTVRIWNPKTKEVKHELEVGAGVFDVQISPDSRYVLATALDETVSLWSTETGSPLWSSTFSPGTIERGRWRSTAGGDGRMNREGPFDLTRSRVFLPDRTSARLVDLATGEQVLRLGHGAIRGDYSPDGRFLLLVGQSGADQRTLILEAGSGKTHCLLEPEPLDPDVELSSGWASWSPDGRSVVVLTTGRRNGEFHYGVPLRIWDVATCSARVSFRGHLSAVYTARYDLDSHVIATAGDDRTARSWSASTGAAIGVFSGHLESIVNGVSPNPSGRRFLSYTYLDAVVWAADGSELIRLPGWSEETWWSGANWSPDGLTALLVEDTDAVYLHRAVPWRTEDLPGDEQVPLGERIRLWRDQRAAEVSH